MTVDQVQTLVDKADKQTHSLLLSIIKYWSEKHPDESVRAELNWYYTEWIKNNSLIQLTSPRTNDELASALQNLYSYRSDSLANGASPNSPNTQREIAKLQNKINSSRSDREARRYKLEILALQNSLRT